MLLSDTQTSAPPKKNPDRLQGLLPKHRHALKMCAARFSGCLNGSAEDASCSANAPVVTSRMLDWTGAGPRILHTLEMGMGLTVFYQKKSQRPERRTFHIRQDTRQIVWSRNRDKIEGEGEYQAAGSVDCLMHHEAGFYALTLAQSHGCVVTGRLWQT